MKVNTLSKEAGIAQIWSTPDRVSHEHMWLWDSVFHSLGMNHLYPRVSCYPDALGIRIAHGEDTCLIGKDGSQSRAPGPDMSLRQGVIRQRQWKGRARLR